MKMTLVFLFLFLLLFYWLYENGCLIVNSKRAIMYVGSLKGRKAKFTSCTGQIRRIVRFKESKSYHFHFHCELTGGEVSVELLDRSKQRLIFFKNGQQEATAALEEGKRYVLVFRFKGATGHYLLEWT